MMTVSSRKSESKAALVLGWKKTTKGPKSSLGKASHGTAEKTSEEDRRTKKITEAACATLVTVCGMVVSDALYRCYRHLCGSATLGLSVYGNGAFP
jgi:hypothetical protein